MLTQKRKSTTAEVPVASLADVAFLLLIFFLVTTTINVDTGIGLTLPEKRQTPVHPENVTNLLINSAGEIMLDDKRVELDEIKHVIRKKVKKNPNLIVSVKTDRSTKYERFVQALDELKMAKATRISLANLQ